MKKQLIAILLLFPFCQICAQQISMPKWFYQVFSQNRLNEKFEVKNMLKPGYLEADFNGDGIKDIAVMVQEKKNHKIGIVLIHGGTFQYLVFGAGNPMGKVEFSETDNLKWMNGWKVYSDKIAYQTKFNNGEIVGSYKRKLSNNAISLWALEDGEPVAGGLIVWNGKKYIWIHQGE